MESFKDATPLEVNEALERSWQAFLVYRKKTGKERSFFMRAIASGLQQHAKALIALAASETHLDEPRLKLELKRTIFQMESYAAACEQGSWLDIRINTAEPHRNPPRPDLRKMLVPLGPVVVFGASNFPFAYSTAGGDTACALAAGCSVVIKAHPAHPATSEKVASIIHAAANACGLPASVCIHLHGASFETGKLLVLHPGTKAVGFTGSAEGGKALFQLASQRQVPIPVFAEMGSVNPVFLLPGKLEQESGSLAKMLADSITLSAGQFCTNPGLMVAIDGAALQNFTSVLSEKIRAAVPRKMLHSGIARAYHRKREAALSQQGVALVAETELAFGAEESIPTIATVPANEFLNNPLLHQEVFGPFSLLVTCTNMKQMLQVAEAMEGQLTATLIANDAEVKEHPELVGALQNLCGRLILNGVPTGVDVALAMHHGGPFPATTDSRFTAVGADGIKRFARPVCYQNWSEDLLPPELQNSNPLQLWRTVNDKPSQDAIG